MTFGHIGYICRPSFRMKRIGSILTLSIFLFNIIGFFILFSFLNLRNKTTVGSILKSESFSEVVRVHKSELKNVILQDEGKEIVLNGEMYDIQSISLEGDYLVFNVIHDKRETSLLACLGDHVKNNLDTNIPGKKQNDSLKNPLQDLFFYEKNSRILNFYRISFQTMNCKLQTVSLLPRPLPPPEITIC
jgi:hypothetical protein